MATTARISHPPASNGVIVAPPKGVVGGNRKKQKRRAKQAAKAAAQGSGPLSPSGADIDYDEDPLGYAEEDDDEYSDAEQLQYADRDHYSSHDGTNGHSTMQTASSKKNKKKKKRTGTGDTHDPYDPDTLGSSLPDLPRGSATVTSRKPNARQQNIWNTTSQQERQNIRDFWLSLSEDERKSLLKIEKEAVLRKMKQQQKHSCSCSVCGRKRMAIEEELEVLYEGYYEELEQYAHHDHPPLPGADGMLPAPLSHAHSHRPRAITAPPPPPQSHHRTSQMLEHLEDDEEYSEDDAEFSDDEDYSEEDIEPPRGPVPDFFNFGQNLTVKDNLLTVADDLLKNDGRKFIEMMEQLAERRMQRENEAEYAAANPSHPGGFHPNDPGYNNDDPMAPSEEYDDDDEASYDSQEEYEDELEDEDEMNALTEEQRMQEGRRMFQIFAARMFEHRVLTAYKEKVAAERQQRLLEELQNEEQLEAQREAKKKRDAEKKKDKKKQQQAAKAEERAKKEAEKAAEEARLREAEEKKQEEQRRKKEEQRKKKEEERRKLEEERLRKEADRVRRQQEEQSRREEAERKAREQKAAEKARKEEQKKREKEEREAREQSAKDRKAQEEKERRDRDAAKARTDRETKADQAQHQPPQIAKRPSHTNMVAVPGVLTKQPTAASPKSANTAPSTAKASVSVPAKNKQNSQQGSHASSPRQAQSYASSVPSKSTSPGSLGPAHAHTHAPKTILQKPTQLQRNVSQPHPQAYSPMGQQSIPPPPGMPIPQQQQQQQQQHHLPNAFSPMPPMGYHPFQHQPGHTLPGGMRSPMPVFTHNAPNHVQQGRIPPFQSGPNMNGIHGPPPGILANQGRNAGFPFDAHVSSAAVPPGFGPQSSQQQISPIGSTMNNSSSIPTHTQDISRTALGSHSRQHSVNEKSFDTTIGRPAPIQPPSSAKTHDENTDVEDLSKQLGSSALLDDDDPQPLARRPSQRNGPLDSMAGGFGGGAAGSFGATGSSWNTPFNQSPGLGQQWGSLPQAGMSGWSGNTGGFGAIGPAAGLHRPGLLGSSRPLTIRIAVCQACQRLSGGVNGPQEFHDVGALLRQIEMMRPPLDSAPTLTEIELICETEGDAQNGGGELAVRKAGNGSIVGVRWQPTGTAPDVGRIGGMGSLGEIGSPLPGKSTPVMGFGAPGRGRVGGNNTAGSGW